MIPFVSSREMRLLDQKTIEAGTPGIVLMERAGRGMAQLIKEIIQSHPHPNPHVLLIAGKGNNGGDTFVIARHLFVLGVRFSLWITAKPESYSGDAKEAFKRFRQTGIKAKIVAQESDWKEEQLRLPLADIVVDGLLGTGTTGAPKGTVEKAISLIHSLRKEATIVSIDVPSGINPDTGEVPGACVQADFTLTAGLPKQGFLNPDSYSYTGSIYSIDLGIPGSFWPVSEEENIPRLISQGFDILPPRPRDSHKGCFGHVLCLGGSKGLTGAIRLCAMASVNSGAGKTSVLTPRSQAPIVAMNHPALMVYEGIETPEGQLTPEALQVFTKGLHSFDTIIAGPGLGGGPSTRVLVEHLLKEFTGKLILDADAITAFAGTPEHLQETNASLILTPHPGELSTLLDYDLKTLQSNRKKHVRRAAKRTHAIVVLKGSGTILASPNGDLAINLTGNPALATGGSGDVLVGMIGALWAQGLSAFDAASAAVYEHGKRADMKALKKHALCPTALI